MEYRMTIAGVERDLTLFPINDKLQIAAFIMFSDVEITVECAKALLKKAPDFDVIITAECKGIPLTYEMSRQSGKNYVVARKKPKLYMKNLITTEVDSITTSGLQSLCIGEAEINLLKGKKVLIVDDVISTGESIKAIEYLINEAGGIIAGKMCVLAEGDAAERDDVIYLEPLPLFDADGNAI